METRLLALVLASAGAAGFTQGFAGFGSTVVALPLLAMALDMRAAVPLGCLMALSINVVLAARLRRRVEKKALALLLGASLPGMAVGVWLLGRAPEAWLKGLLGAVVLGLAAQSLGRAGPRRPSGRIWAVAAGLVAGCLGVCIGVNGPPIVAWAAREPWDRDAFKATLASFFLLAGVGIVGAQALDGVITTRTLGFYALSLPALLLGLWAGATCSGRAGEALFRRAALCLLACMGAILLWQAAASLLF